MLLHHVLFCVQPFKRIYHIAREFGYLVWHVEVIVSVTELTYHVA